MTNENTILKIKAELEKLGQTHGTFGGAVPVRDPYVDGTNEQPELWSADALNLDGTNLEHGEINWDFEEYVNERVKSFDGARKDLDIDGGDFPWNDENTYDFTEKNGVLDLNDEDDLNEALELLKLK